MNEEDKKWQMFQKTGRIGDYLRYCEVKQETENEFQNNRDSFKTKELSE
ncbi:MAG: hypothetical protein K2I60_01095 [Oscillospiraceae bacterium]|nr:hypothetical protein [Oscillospiraceae bacterium]